MDRRDPEVDRRAAEAHTAQVDPLVVPKTPGRHQFQVGESAVQGHDRYDRSAQRQQSPDRDGGSTGLERCRQRGLVQAQPGGERTGDDGGRQHRRGPPGRQEGPARCRGARHGGFSAGSNGHRCRAPPVDPAELLCTRSLAGHASANGPGVLHFLRSVGVIVRVPTTDKVALQPGAESQKSSVVSVCSGGPSTFHVRELERRAHDAGGYASRRGPDAAFQNRERRLTNSIFMHDWSMRPILHMPVSINAEFNYARRQTEGRRQRVDTSIDSS